MAKKIMAINLMVVKKNNGYKVKMIIFSFFKKKSFLKKKDSQATDF